MARKGERLKGQVVPVYPALHTGQQAVLRDAKQINWLCAGRGWRKTSLMVKIALDALLSGKKVWWTSFEPESIDIAIEEIWKPLVFGEDVWNECYHEEDRYLYLPGLRPMRFTSLKAAARQRGSTPDVIINDEAGMTPRNTFVSIIRPMIFKSGGTFWGVGTPDPNDPLNDFYEYLTHQNAAEEAGDNSRTARFVIPVVGAQVTDRGELIRQPHPYENPEKTWEELKASWDETPLGSQRVAWEIEHLCVFRLGGSEQIANVGRVCVLPCLPGRAGFPNEWFLDGWTHYSGAAYVAGVDLGVAENFTVLSVGDEKTRKMVYFRRFIPTTLGKDGRWKQVREAIKRVHDLFPKVNIRVDVTGEGNALPEDMDTDYKVSVEPFNFSGTSQKKIELMNHLSDVVENQSFLLFNLDVIREEMSILKRIRTESGGLQIKAPKQKFDDVPVSIGLMVKDVELTDAGTKAAEVERHRELLEAALQRDQPGIGSLGALPQSRETASVGWGSGMPDWNLF